MTDFWSVVHFGMNFANIVKISVKMKEKINLNESVVHSSLVEYKLLEIINVLLTLFVFFPH